MASPSTEAIGAVSELLRTRLSAALNNLNVAVGRPDAAAAGQGRLLNLFLYRVALDPHLRNEPLDRGQLPPLWLSLHFLLTAFDDSRESESVAAHRLLGQGMAALQSLNFMRPPALNLALAGNPEPLKITFDDADVELLSKLMQGSDEKYRLSAALQVRPVMLKLDADPGYAPLVKTIGPVVPQPSGPPAPAGISVLPSLGATLARLEPARFEAGQQITVYGAGLAGYGEALLGPHTLPLLPGPEGQARFTVPAAAAIAADGYGLCIARLLPSGRRITSNALLAELLPTVAPIAALDGPTLALPPVNGVVPRHGRFTVSGSQLGGSAASVFASLYAEGQAHGLLEADAGSTQTLLRFTVPASAPLPAGSYRVVLRVNGQQSANAPELIWA